MVELVPQSLRHLLLDLRPSDRRMNTRKLSVILASTLLLGACKPAQPSVVFTSSPKPSPSLTASPKPSVSSSIHRPRATNPGAPDPKVTQANIAQTICVKGYTATVRPPVSYTSPLKRKQITEYGYTDTNMTSYEEDHIIPLELGGAPSDIKNLWPQPIAEAKVKDRDENTLHSDVCSGKLQLIQAQQKILAQWGSK